MAVLDGAVAAICVWVSLHPLLPRPARCLRAVLGMSHENIIQEALISRITQLTERIEDLEKKLDQAHRAVWDLSVGVNNLMGLANETQRDQYRHLLLLAEEVRK